MKPCYCLILLLFLGSCISVSKEQRTTVQQFAVKAGKFSTLPEKIWMELADIRELRGVYYANSFTDPVTHLSELDAIVQERISNDKIPARVRPVFKILENYANGLVQLSGDASKKLRIAHLALEEALNETKTLKEVTARLSGFYSDVEKLYKMVDELNKKDNNDKNGQRDHIGRDPEGSV